MILEGCILEELARKLFSFLPLGLIKEFIYRDCHFIHPTLNFLYESIPTLLLASKSANTIKTYIRGIKKWVTWSAQFPELHSFPVKATSLTLFITSMVQSAERLSGITQTFNGLKFLHDITGTKNSCRNKMVKTALESARRILSKPIKKKEPIKPRHLRKLGKFLTEDANSLPNYRTLAICCVAFSGFLRFNEISSLRRSDISFHNSHMKIFIEKSKTDIYRDGAHVLIARTGSLSCPYKILQKYIALTNIPETSDEHIFRAIAFSRKQGTYKLRPKDRPISYSRTREIVLDTFGKIGLNKKNFSLQNLYKIRHTW